MGDFDLGEGIDVIVADFQPCNYKNRFIQIISNLGIRRNFNTGMEYEFLTLQNSGSFIQQPLQRSRILGFTIACRVWHRCDRCIIRNPVDLFYRVCCSISFIQCIGNDSIVGRHNFKPDGFSRDCWFRRCRFIGNTINQKGQRNTGKNNGNNQDQVPAGIMFHFVRHDGLSTLQRVIFMLVFAQI